MSHTAVIDIGSNTIIMTIVNGRGQVVVDSPVIVGLGRGLDATGVFAQDRMIAAEETLSSFIAIARSHGVPVGQIRAVTTSAARRARNAQDWLTHLHQTLGLTIRIISGLEEAELTWRGSVHAQPTGNEHRLLVDLGGGSTEIIQGVGASISHRVSLEMGTVRLTEAFGLNAGHVSAQTVQAARDSISLHDVPTEHAIGTVTGVAGTITALAAIKQQLTAFDKDKLHNSTLTQSNLTAFIRAYRTMTIPQRLAISHISPRRAPHLLAGAIILSSILEHTHAPHLTVSVQGLRFGLLSSE